MTRDQDHATALERANPGASELKALSIRQPWCYRILNKGKDVENRTWKTSFRGEVLIHASKTIDVGEQLFVRDNRLKLGGIVGIMEITDCVTEMESDWFEGRYGFVIENARPLPFIPCKGALGFFKPKPYEVSNEH